VLYCLLSQVYVQYSDRIKLQVSQLKEIIFETSRRSKERVWLRNQSQGELDDSKLIDGLSGERCAGSSSGSSSTIHICVQYLCLT
jgi:hypothetical protein